jgi:hypothetical protein
MNSTLRESLRRQGKLAFRRVRPGAELLKRFHRLPTLMQNDDSLRRLGDWLVVPFSLWPVDIIGLAAHVFALAENGKLPTKEFRELIRLIGIPPKEEICDEICEHENLVKGGSYESLIKAQHKFDARERRLLTDAEFLADWRWIANHFDLTNHRGDSGVIRRRMVSERNFHPDEWDFSWRTKKQRFENVFDAFCHKWTLYGMIWDKPLLQKLSVNITPYGTMIVIPRYWSFDYNRDLKWRFVAKLHHSRDVQRQGEKLEANLSERRTLATAARRFMAEAKRLGKKGDAKDQWVMKKIGMLNSDPRQLRRLLKVK